MSYDDSVRHAGPDTYDDIPYHELPIEEIDWSQSSDHIRHRSIRKGRPNEIDIEPECATEAALDPDRLVADSRSRSGLSVEVIGFSPLAGRVLVVILVPKDHPPTGEWWGVSAWIGRAESRKYELARSVKEQGDEEEE